MSNPTLNSYSDFSSEPEISIYEIVQFLKKNRLNLLFGLLIGLVFGGIGGGLLSKQKAVISLDNLSSISYSEWNGLSSSIPHLVANVQETLKRDGKERPEDRYLAQSVWWEKHVKPTFAYDKNTAKELGAVPSEIKAEYGRILALTIDAEARDETEAYRRADGAVNMIRDAAIYLRLQSMLVGLRTESIQTELATSSLFVQNTIDQAYLQKDLTTLRELIAFNAKEINARVASINKVINDANAVEGGGRNVFNIRGGETPEIPLDAKLNEIKLNLHAKEMERLRTLDRQAQNAVLQSFLVEAETIFNAGNMLVAHQLLDQFLDLEQRLREKTGPGNFVELAKLDQIRAALLNIQLTYIYQLTEVSRSIEPVNRISVGILGGGFGGFSLALIGAWLVGLYRNSEQAGSEL